jgi:transposase InsO family protein
MLENKFKSRLIREIENMFPGCLVLHGDANEVQGIPDILILYKDTWAALEGKRCEDAPCRPNQNYYIERMNQMSYASFVYPENKEEVLYELQQAFSFRRTTRLPKRK